MGEGKDVLGMAKFYTNRYAFRIAAYLEAFFQYLHQRGCYMVLIHTQAARQDMKHKAMMFVNIAHAMLSG